MSAREFARATWPGLLVAAIGFLGFFVLLDWVTEQERLWSLDQPVLEWLAAHRTDGLTTVMTVITNLFGPVMLPIAVGIAVLVWGRVTHRWFEPLVLGGAMVFASVLSLVLKVAVGRPRPEEDLMVVPGLVSTASFPSGHTMMASTLVLVGGYLVWHRRHSALRLVVWVVASVVIIALVAMSRLYLGYHFLTDVMAGACVGVGVLGLTIVLVRWTDARRAVAA